MMRDSIRTVRASLALATAVSGVLMFTGDRAAYAQVLDGTQGNITVPLLSDIPAGTNGLVIRRFSSNDTAICCDNTAYQFERPDAAVNLINAGAAKWSNTPATDTVTRPVLNFADTGSNGRFQPDDPPPNSPANTDINNWVSYTRGTIRVPAAGTYTFNFNSDDSFVMAFPTAGGGSLPWTSVAGQDANLVNGTKLIGFRTNASVAHTANGAYTFPAGRGSNDSFGTINLPAGDLPFVIVHEDGNGGGNAELSSAAGTRTAHDASVFTLVGGQAIPGANGQNRVQTVGPWSLKEYTGVANVDAVITNGRTNTGTQRGTTTSVPTIRFNDPQGANNGSHGGDSAPFPNDTAADDDNYGAYATASLTITGAHAGRYTFAMYTDDDSRFRILNSGGTPVALVGTTVGNAFDSDGANGNDQFGTTGCCSDYLGHYDLAAGTYTIEAAFHEGGGGSGFFLYGTQGDRNSFDAAAFQLLGANQDLGPWNLAATPALALVPEPGTAGMLALAAVGLIARRRRRHV